ncbi:Brp/Blh family beta-carotene 15,15'-dioxygenase [Methylophilaceae bacterium]|nr:Brp/Blh family beta-carotene 15,15'-dioxygenase [Methylophilaceae bacterium]
MSKILKHQIFVIVSALVILTLYFFLLPSTHLNLDFNLLSKANPILLISFLLISTFGISHGAFDGKIIWMSGGKRNAFILYLIYISISLLGLILWLISPTLGLFILLLISTIHFGHSDLAYIGNRQKYLKYSWGLAMTFMPVLFHSSSVSEIFYLLTDSNAISSTLIFLKYLISLNLILLTSYVMFNLLKIKDKIYFLLMVELTIMIILGYYLHPLVWFAFYFCILHGIRALINYNFNFFSDTLWLILFTAPITLIIIYMNLDLSFEGFLFVFPILACLTIAHMLLPKIISFSKTKLI